MRKIIFITSGKIRYKFEGKTLYESIEIIANGKRFPHLEKNAESEVESASMSLDKYKPGFVFSATSYQCLESAKLITQKIGSPLIKKVYLLPLRFELNKFFNEDDFEKLGEYKFIELRKRFLESFYDNNLIDDREEIMSRYTILKKDIEKNPEGTNIIVVSHAYLIKLFSIYYQVGDRMYKDKDLLFKLFNPYEEPFKRLETLILEI